MSGGVREKFASSVEASALLSLTMIKRVEPMQQSLVTAPAIPFKTLSGQIDGPNYDFFSRARISLSHDPAVVVDNHRTAGP